jgi:hypothetical protein
LKLTKIPAAGSWVRVTAELKPLREVTLTVVTPEFPVSFMTMVIGLGFREME